MRHKRCGSIPESGRSSGGGNCNPLRCSCLENPMDRGAWWATVNGVLKSQTRLSTYTLKNRERVMGCKSQPTSQQKYPSVENGGGKSINIKTIPIPNIFSLQISSRTVKLWPLYPPLEEDLIKPLSLLSQCLPSKEAHTIQLSMDLTLKIITRSLHWILDDDTECYRRPQHILKEERSSRVHVRDFEAV